MVVTSELIDILADKLRIQREDINYSQHLVDDLGADSLDVIEILMEVSDKFGIDDIEDDVIKEFKTVGDLAKYVSKHRRDSNG